MTQDYWYEIIEGSIKDLGQCVSQGSDEAIVKQAACDYYEKLYQEQGVLDMCEQELPVYGVLARYLDKGNDTEEVLTEIKITIFK